MFIKKIEVRPEMMEEEMLYSIDIEILISI